jgi:hypothetical protein
MQMADEAPAAVEAPQPLLMDAPLTSETVVEGEAEVVEGEAEVVEGEKPEGEKPEGEAEVVEGEKEETPEGAPEEYADFEAPDGVTLNAEKIDKLKEFSKAKNLTQAEAQGLVDMAVELQAEQNQAFADQIIEQRAAWREQAQADPEFGGKAFATNLPIAVAGRDRFGTPELTELLNQSGLGDHPEVIRLFYRVGKATGEHDFVNGSTSAPTGSFYDHPTSKPKR